MKLSFATVWILISTGLTACGIGPHQMNGVSGRERTEYLNSIKPYGAHWIKDGMTRESRRIDLIACGSINFEDVRFPEDQLKLIRLPNEPNDISAHLRLRDQLGVCMASRRYKSVGDLKYLGGCDERCMYP